MPTVESTDRVVVIEVRDEDNVLVESINALVGMVLEVPDQRQPVVFEVPAPPGVEIALVPAAGQEVHVVEAFDGPLMSEVLTRGPQGPPGDTRVHIGPTPPEDTTMVWVDTS